MSGEYDEKKELLTGEDADSYASFNPDEDSADENIWQRIVIFFRIHPSVRSYLGFLFLLILLMTAFCFFRS